MAYDTIVLVQKERPIWRPKTSKHRAGGEIGQHWTIRSLELVLHCLCVCLMVSEDE